MPLFESLPPIFSKVFGSANAKNKTRVSLAKLFKSLLRDKIETHADVRESRQVS